MTRSEIERLIEEEKYIEALEILSQEETKDSENALWPFMQGDLLWRLGRKGEAISAFGRASVLKGEWGRAAMVRLQHARDIMDFYCTDLLNP